jgi:hypothetical protein
VVGQSVKHLEKQRFFAEKLTEYQEIKRFNDAKTKKSLVIYLKRTP